MADRAIQPMPLKALVINDQEQITDPWSKWLRDLARRIEELEARVKALEDAP